MNENQILSLLLLFVYMIVVVFIVIRTSNYYYLTIGMISMLYGSVMTNIARGQIK